MSNPASQFFDKATKAPLSGGEMFFEEPGTVTPKPTFKDSLGTIANTNPVLLDANGVLPNIFGDGSYRVVLRASPIAPATSGVQQWERDPVIFEAGGEAFNEWVETTTYEINNIVEASDGAFYIAIAQSTNVNPAGGTNNEFWSRFDLINRWNPAETYVADDVVRGSDGIIYTAVQGSFNQDPIADTAAANWKMFDNIRIDGNTISVTDTDGDLNLNSNGTGVVTVNGSQIGTNITIQTFTANDTWTRPTDVKFITVEGVGGGAGGGGISAGAGVKTGQGGGGSGYFRSTVDVTAIASLTVTIGTGGSGVSNADGTDGTDTVISGAVSLTADGGEGGLVEPVGTLNINNNGGGASGGDLNITGNSGGFGAAGIGGSGGSSFLGTSLTGPFAISTGESDGIDAIGFGSGGTGAAAGGSATSAHAGGDGSDGFVIFTEYR